MGYRTEHAMELLQVLADHYEVRTDRAALLQSLTTQPLDGDDQVWLWLSRNAAQLGLRLGVVDVTTAEISTFARQGYPIVLAADGLLESSSEVERLRWVVITRYHRGGFEVWEVGDQPRKLRWSKRRLLKWLGSPDRHGKWRALTAQCIGVGMRPELTALSPFRRLVRMIRPDRADISAMFVFSVVVGVLTLAAPLAVEALVNTVAFGRYLQPILVLSFILFTFLGFAAALRMLLAIVAELIQRRLFARVAEDLGYRLPRVDAKALDNENGGELVNRFLDVSNVQKTISSLLMDGITLLVSAAIGMIVLAFYHPFLLGFDLILLSLMAFVVFVLGRGAVGTAQKESKAKYKVTAWFEELMNNPTAFMFHGGQRFALDRSDKLAVDYLDYRIKHFHVLLRQIGFAVFTYAFAMTVLLGLGGWLVITGELTLGQLVAAELIVSVVVGAFAKMGKHMESYYDMLASVDKLGVILDLPMEVAGGILQLDVAGPASVNGVEISVSAGKSSVLKSWCGEAVKGGLTVVYGPPASGKSVLLEALVGRRTVSQGQVLIDGFEINQLDTESVRQQIGYTRDVEIFHGTVAENVHLYRPNIRTNDVRDALRQVGLLDELQIYGECIDKDLQTGGRPLSRDQALRLMIARAIVGRPRVLVLDGTLDSLSDSSLELCLQNLTVHPQPWTMIVATGRRSIRERADRTWELVGNKSVSRA